MTLLDYLELLDWTSRQIAPGKRGSTLQSAPPILERLKCDPQGVDERLRGKKSAFVKKWAASKAIIDRCDVGESFLSRRDDID
jgi:hypothetical protein